MPTKAHTQNADSFEKVGGTYTHTHTLGESMWGYGGGSCGAPSFMQHFWLPLPAAVAGVRQQ